MAVRPVQLARVPNVLTSRQGLSNLNRTNLGLLDIQTQLSTGRAVNRTSDDPVRASAISVINRRLSLAEQRTRNLDHAATVIGALDTAISGDTGLQSLVRSAQDIASAQIDSDATTRANQATVVDSIIRSIVSSANRPISGIYPLGGSTATRPPIEELGEGFRYVARGAGLFTDLGLGDAIPIALGAGSAIGEVSSRLRSTIDLNPNLTGGTLLADLTGGRGLGVTLGTVGFAYSGGPAASVDLTGAESVTDVVNRLTAAIRQYESDNALTVLGAGGITVSGGGLSISTAGTSGETLTFTDPTGSTVGADLGLTQAAFSQSNAAGADLEPRLTLQTPLTALGGVTLPLGSIRLRVTGGTGSTVRDVDLSGAQTVGDLRSLIESTNLGVRVGINSTGTGLALQNEVAGRTLAVEEVASTGGTTATALGIRTLTATTPTADLNNGRGVRIVNGATDPISGAIDPARNTDLRIILGNGNSFDVDLRPQDLATVQTVIDRINAEAASAVTAGSIPAGAFSAGLTNGPNGLALRDLAGLGAIRVENLNNSAAAEDLGLLNGTFDTASATFVAQDRATLRVNNVLSDLSDLRDALLRNDRSGIALAAEQLDGSADRLIAAHALVGTYGRRIDLAKDQVSTAVINDEKTRGDLQDTDFAEASVRLSQLETQLQATLQTIARFQNRSLLDFLG
jgi:flagellin-like hook-associated protein FlgL